MKCSGAMSLPAPDDSRRGIITSATPGSSARAPSSRRVASSPPAEAATPISTTGKAQAPGSGRRRSPALGTVPPEVFGWPIEAVFSAAIAPPSPLDRPAVTSHGTRPGSGRQESRVGLSLTRFVAYLPDFLARMLSANMQRIIRSPWSRNRYEKDILGMSMNTPASECDSPRVFPLLRLEFRDAFLSIARKATTNT